MHATEILQRNMQTTLLHFLVSLLKKVVSTQLPKFTDQLGALDKGIIKVLKYILLSPEFEQYLLSTIQYLDYDLQFPYIYPERPSHCLRWLQALDGALSFPVHLRLY